MGDDFDLRRYFLDIADPEERARAIHESGWAGDPDIEDIEVPVARLGGGKYQNLLASFRKPPPLTPKRERRVLERIRLAHPRWFDVPRQGMTASIDEAPVEVRLAESIPAPPSGAEVDVAPSVAKSASPPPERVLIPPTPDYPLVPGSLTEAIAWHVYENQAKFWPHIKGEVVPRPAGYVPKPAPPVTATKSSDLTGEQVVRLYDAIAFAMWQHGAIMNTHVVILWETLWVHDHKRATTLLSEYLNQAKKWARVGTVGAPRQRRRGRTGEGFEFRYVYVHECGGAAGFHSHILCTVPQPTAKAFAAWSRKTLARLARHHGDGRTVRVVASNARDEGAAVARGWNWFRYISKQLDQNVGWGPVDGPFRPLREILKLWPYRTARPVACAQMVGGSQDIWTKAQRESGFKSELRSGELERIYYGKELDDWRERERYRRFVEEILPTLAIG
jgi:hypothetical protein